MAIKYEKKTRRTGKPQTSAGRPRIEDRDKTVEAAKPWLELRMSRRTWYRRKAEGTL